MDINLTFLNCPICEDCLNEPYECKNCHTCFCKKCINRNKYCINCKKNDFFPNQGLKKILEQLIFPCLNCNKVFKTIKELENHIDKKDYEKNKCILCSEEFDYLNFYNHIIQKHKNHLIEIFDSKSLYNKGQKVISLKKSFNLSNYSDNNIYNNIDTKSIKKSFSNIMPENNREDLIISVEPIMQLNSNESNIISGNIIDIKQQNKNKTDIDFNYSNSIKYNSNNFDANQKKNNKEFESAIQLPNLHYCNQPKGICKNCSSRICKEGNCFCLGCMEYNVKNQKLKKGELINKKGRLAKKYNGVYYCNIGFIEETQTYNGPISLQIKCCSLTNCKECKDLNKISKQYEEFIRYD